MTDSDFILRARERLDAVRDIIESLNTGTTARATILALLPLAESAIDAVADEGTLPSYLCTAVVKYGAKP